MMPLEVLKHAQDEFLDFNGQGASVIEMSHRSKEYQAVAQQAEQDLRDLLNIPSRRRPRTVCRSSAESAERQ